ncbi:hypothetical protein AMTRI_Chr03g141290 [Amborella trichopoda]
MVVSLLLLFHTFLHCKGFFFFSHNAAFFVHASNLSHTYPCSSSTLSSRPYRHTHPLFFIHTFESPLVLVPVGSLTPIFVFVGRVGLAINLPSAFALKGNLFKHLVIFYPHPSSPEGHSTLSKHTHLTPLSLSLTLYLSLKEKAYTGHNKFVVKSKIVNI